MVWVSVSVGVAVTLREVEREPVPVVLGLTVAEAGEDTPQARGEEGVGGQGGAVPRGY